MPTEGYRRAMEDVIKKEKRHYILLAIANIVLPSVMSILASLAFWLFIS